MAEYSISVMVKANKILNYWVYNGTNWSLYNIQLVAMSVRYTLALTKHLYNGNVLNLFVW